MSYDLVIKNGTVVDGTGAARYQADVAIADGKVVAVGPIEGLLLSQHPWVKSYVHGDRARVRAATHS